MTPFIQSWMAKNRARIDRATPHPSGIPVICIGNLVVGGSGKSPVVGSLATLLKAEGYQPGIVSRGYGGLARHLPIDVRADSRAERVGDEPLMLHRQTGCPVVVCKDRARAVDFLHHHYRVDVILSDDGLQHAPLWRDLSICVFHAEQGIGNGLPLPFGPLREPLSALEHMDAIVVRGTSDAALALQNLGIETAVPCFASETSLAMAYRSDRPEVRVPIGELAAQGTWHAVAGIAAPDRFFAGLEAHGLSVEAHPFPDHHAYTEKDLEEWPLLLTTEKDAVKLVHCRKTPFWVASLELAQAAFDAWILEKLTRWKRV